MCQLLVTAIILVLGSTVLVECQLNGVKPLLIPCYNVSAIPGVIIANNRPPTNLNIFLELLRRLEDANPNLSARELSALIVQRLRQNGIIISSGRVIDLSIGIPFAPYGLEAIKGTIILQEYLTNSSQILNFGDLVQADLCSFHYMISNSINETIRGDESSTCVRSARYQTRAKRDVEVDKNTDKVEGGEDEDGDTEKVEKFAPRHLNTNSGQETSQCPIELGVVYTNHGTVKIGQVLTGLAAGFNQEPVKNSDNRYAATLAGDLAHTALSQVSTFDIGASGGWNSTINPKYFFVQKSEYYDMTDQDIKGSLDGLLLSLQVETIKKRSEVKLSQIIDMYYSPSQRGVFDPSFRACNRNILYSEYVSTEKLWNEVNLFIQPLDTIGQYPITLPAGFNYTGLVDGVVNNFTSYLPRINADLACPQLDSPIETVDTDLLIFLDPNWSYTTIQPVLSYILDSIDVSKYGSRYTLFSGVDGYNITNSTSHLLDFHQAYNLSAHQNLSSVSREFDYSKIYEKMESVVRSKLNNNSYTGGESTVVLLVPRSAPSESQKTFLEQRKEIMRQYMPDISVIVLGSGSSGDYSSVLFNPSKDFVSLSESTNDNDLKPTAQTVIDRIKTIPRSIVNPNCGSGFTGSSSTFTITQYVDQNSINYYKIAPNYFFRGDGTRNLKITEISTGGITVCISRDQTRPSSQNTDCKFLQASTQVTDISGWCGSNLADCAPIYVSIYGNTTRYLCRDYYCRYPDSVKYIISMENVGCTSSAFTVAANFFLVAALLVFLRS